MDLNFYKNFNDDLNNLNKLQLSNHFRKHGYKENRIYNAKTFSNYYFDNNIDYNDQNIKIFYESNILKNLVKSIPLNKRPRKIKLLLFTNCQGHHIHAFLTKINIFNKYFDIYTIRNYIDMNEDEKNDFDNLLLDIDIFIYQPVREQHSNNSKNILIKIPDRVIKISMPYTVCNWLWLFGIELHGTLDYLNDYSNLNKNDIENLLKNNIINFNIIERMNNSLAILKEKESTTDIKTHEYIINNYKNKRLFFTKNHLSKYLVIHIGKELLKLLEINIEINEDNFNLGIYNTAIFYPITSYIKNILNLNYDDGIDADNFYIDYFYDYIKKESNEYLINKYNLNENNSIFD